MIDGEDGDELDEMEIFTIYGSTIVIATLLTTLWLPFSNHKDGTDIRIHRLDYTTTVPSFQSFAD
jgi:hypothetical protein